MNELAINRITAFIRFKIQLEADFYERQKHLEKEMREIQLLINEEFKQLQAPTYPES